MALPALLSALGAGLATPQGSALAAAALPFAAKAIGSGISGLGRLFGYGNNNQAPVPELLAQQGLLQQLQQPINAQPIDYAPLAQQAQRQYAEQIVPGIAERFSSVGGQRSNAFRNALISGGQGLAERLAGLQLQADIANRNAMQQSQGLNLQRLGQLGGYLSGQQQLGFAGQQAAEAARRAQQESLLKAYGLSSETAGQQQQLAQQRQALQQQAYLGTLAPLQNLTTLGVQPQSQTVYQPSEPGLVPQFGTALATGLLGSLGVFK